MNYKDTAMNDGLLRKHITTQLDNITCINCCKYYLVPTTATCGHSLCHTCWRTNRTCPICALQVDKKALRLNSPLQTLTEHTLLLGKAFQSLFKINLNDITLSDEQQHVKEWLANSSNQFSATVTTSQPFTEEPIKPIHQVQDIQIHTRNLRVKEPEREIVQMNFEQDDWDKIEEMPEVVKNKSPENAVGPMDIEPFDFNMDDQKYNTHNLRRSSRNKELKTSNTITNDVSSDKESGKSVNINSNKKSKNLGLNWKNVKRMKKEFSKLNKKNNNKLNVSIEMCKKAKPSANKAAPFQTEQVSYNIDDNTPGISLNNDIEMCVPLNSANLNKDNQINKEIHTYISKDQSISSLNGTDMPNKVLSNSAFVHNQYKQQLKSDLQDKSNTTLGHFNKDARTTKVNFFKRGPLQTNFLDTGVINAEPNIKISNTARLDTDDIEITIKIGKTVSNICIQKKEKDVKVNIKSDQEIQTSLSTFMGNKHNLHSSLIEPNPQIGSHNNIALNNDVSVCTSQQGISKVQIQKSLSTKKNTTSADTSSAHFEITESEEKEFQDQMENVSHANKQDKNDSQKLLKLDCSLKSQVQHSLKNFVAITDDAEFLNDVDIFEGESVKEGNIQPLESTANTPSAIIMPTVKSKSTSQKTTNKRDREISDTETLSKNKKFKITQGSISDSKKSKKAVVSSNILDGESENINYDAIMSQVFANINADMQNLQKTGTGIQMQTQISNTQKSNSKKFQLPIKPNMKQDIIKRTDEETNLKCSENVFSLLEKEDCNTEMLKKTSHKTLGSSQHIIDDSPNVDLAMENNDKNASPNIVDFVEFGTPMQDDDDDDKSVVEETPQKTTSFLKSKNKNEVPAVSDDAEHCLMTENNKSINETGCHGKDTTLEDSANVISISDSAGEITEVRKSALETPLTITKFVDKITHKSTPLARKSLNFSCRNLNNDLEETLCPSSVVAAKTTQEREFMSRAFEQTVESPTHTLHAGKERRRATKLCIAGSCLVSNELGILKQLCLQRNWIFVEKYTKDLTHLVVGVDEENRSQRSVKYICALASAKWIVSFEWVEKCVQLKDIADEEPYEALDAAGEPGPRRSRLSKSRLLQGFTFYCMPPFAIIDIETLKDILEASGGRVVSSAGDVRLKDAPGILLAEPEHTQEDRFIYLAMELQIVPVNYEWVLNCLGTYTLKPISDLLLCPASLLPPAVNNWPPELILSCDE